MSLKHADTEHLPKRDMTAAPPVETTVEGEDLQTFTAMLEEASAVRPGSALALLFSSPVSLTGDEGSSDASSAGLDVCPPLRLAWPRRCRLVLRLRTPAPCLRCWLGSRWVLWFRMAPRLSRLQRGPLGPRDGPGPRNLRPLRRGRVRDLARLPGWRGRRPMQWRRRCVVPRHKTLTQVHPTPLLFRSILMMIVMVLSWLWRVSLWVT